MHALQLIAIEADSPEEATMTVRNLLDGCLEDNERNTWFDWYEIGGRWSGEPFGNNSNVLQLTDENKFHEILGQTLEIRNSYVEKYVRDINFNTLKSSLLSLNHEEGNSGDVFSLVALNSLSEMALGFWNHNNYLYDMVAETPHFQWLRERVTSTPETQYLVAVDFHY